MRHTIIALLLLAGYASSQTIRWSQIRSGEQPYINVKSGPYNAKGDGTTDDTTAIQAALTAGSGKVVFFPSGTYKITAALSIVASGTTLKVENGAYTQIKSTSTTANILAIGNGTDLVSNVTIDGLGFGDASGSNHTAGNAIYVNYAGNIILKNLWIDGRNPATARLYNGVTMHQCVYCSVDDSEIQHIRNVAVSITGTLARGSSNNWVRSNHIHDVAGDAVYSGDYSGGLYMDGNVIYSLTAGYAFNIDHNVGSDCCYFIHNNDVDTSTPADMGFLRLVKAGGLIHVGNNTAGGGDSATRTLISADVNSNPILQGNNLNSGGQLVVSADSSLVLQGGRIAKTSGTAALAISIGATATYSNISGLLVDGFTTGIAYNAASSGNALYGATFINTTTPTTGPVGATHYPLSTFKGGIKVENTGTLEMDNHVAITTNNTWSQGDTSHRWAKIWTVDLEYNGALKGPSSVALTAQPAAITTTNLLAAAAAGTYRVAAYLHTTTQSAGACTSAVTIGWNYNGGAKTATVFTGHSHAVDETSSQGTLVLRSAAAQNITYAVDLTAGGDCTNAVYDLYLTLERLQ